MSQPDPNDHQPTLVKPPEPAESEDLNALPVILARIERTSGHASMRPKEMLVLLRTLKRYAPLTEAAKPELPAVLSTPSCINCGFAVEQRGTLCAACREKEGQYAKPLFEVGQQPTPAYAREREEGTDAV